jgi:hypothetical protein
MRAAVVVVAHLNKGQSTDPIQRLGGSIGLPAAARSVLLLARDPDEPSGERGDRRVLAHVKSNIGPLAPSLRLVIESGQTGTETGAARLVDAGHSSYSGAELLALQPAERASKLGEAIAFLEDELKEGMRPANELYGAAARLGISDQTLRRAKVQLGVKSEKLGVNRGWGWHLAGDAGVEKAA